MTASDSPFDPARFESTVTSVVRGVAEEASEVHRSNLDAITRLYAFPLYDYLTTRLRLDPTTSEDLVQEFLLRKLLLPDRHRNLASAFLRKKEKSPGLRFRDYLKLSLKNFMIDRVRQGGIEAVSLEQVQVIRADPDGDRAVESRFDRRWAENLLKEAVTVVRDDCIRQGQEHIWLVFQRRLLDPVRNSSDPPTYDVLAGELKLRDAKTAANLFQTAIRKFNRVLRTSVEGY